MSMQDREDTLIIGLDFGTTFSGIAYGFAGTGQQEIYSITEWPGLEGYDQPKIDTLISYDAKGGNAFDWGAQARDKKPLVGMKLLLDPQQERPLFIPGSNGKSELKKLGKSAEQVASDYIGALYKHAVEKIENRYPRDYLKRCRRQYVVTVPAVWTDKAKTSTLKAARDAGIFPVDLITEPEAAALYTLHDMQDRALEIGDALVICDAGGGTVDLVSYEIAKLSPRLELKELVPSTGGMAGSLVLNKRFEAVVQEMLGEEEFLQLKKKPAWNRAMSEFDKHVKTAFKGSLDEAYVIDFSRAGLMDDLANDLEDNSWIMSGSTLQAIFSPVITEIEKLVNEQVDQIKIKRMIAKHPKAGTIKAIFLVGGFGSNQYLRRRLQEAQPTIQVIQPNGAWSAIVKGAVLSKMPSEATVTSSVALKHYGVTFSSRYNELEDAGQERYLNPFSGRWECEKTQWYICKGVDLSRSQKISLPFCRRILENGYKSRLVFEDELITSDSVLPPKHPGGNTVKKVTFETDLRDADKRIFGNRQQGADGRRYVQVDYNLTLTPMSGIFKFALEIDGVEYGSVEAEYD